MAPSDRIALEALQRLNAAQSEQIEALKSGGGGGTSGGMEARLARLESDMEHVKNGVSTLEGSASDLKKSVSEIRVDISKGVGEIKTAIATITERTKHFPSRWEVFLILAGLVTAIGAAAKLL